MGNGRGCAVPHWPPTHYIRGAQSAVATDRHQVLTVASRCVGSDNTIVSDSYESQKTVGRATYPCHTFILISFDAVKSPNLGSSRACRLLQYWSWLIVYVYGSGWILNIGVSEIPLEEISFKIFYNERKTDSPSNQARAPSVYSVRSRMKLFEILLIHVRSKAYLRGERAKTQVNEGNRLQKCSANFSFFFNQL